MSEQAISNAKAWFQSIRGMVAAHEAACAKSEADDMASGMRYEGKAGYDATEETEAAEQAILESPLSVQVRSGWYVPGHNSSKPTEYEILLDAHVISYETDVEIVPYDDFNREFPIISTGGPALRIVGDLNADVEPTSATLQWQDWGTPWTPLHMSELPCAASEADATLLSYASHFYFGEG